MGAARNRRRKREKKACRNCIHWAPNRSFFVRLWNLFEEKCTLDGERCGENAICNAFQNKWIFRR